MNKTASQFVPKSYDWDPKYPFDLVMAYEDGVTRDRAMTLYDRIAQQLLDDYDFRCAWWKFDYLRDASLMSQAIEDAVEANMILISLNGAKDLPFLARKWIEAWVPMRPRSKSALVTLLNLPPDEEVSITALQSCLGQVAKQAGMDFFLNVSEAPAKDEYTVNGIHERAQVVTPVLEGILHTHSAPIVRLF